MIKVDELAEIEVSNIHDKTNDVFIWVLEAIYGESAASYWWDNFK